MWWMQEVPNELRGAAASNVEDGGWIIMVAPQYEVQRAQRKLQSKLLSGFVEASLKREYR
jgi:hypothetical protein